MYVHTSPPHPARNTYWIHRKYIDGYISRYVYRSFATARVSDFLYSVCMYKYMYVCMYVFIQEVAFKYYMRWIEHRVVGTYGYSP